MKKLQGGTKKWCPKCQAVTVCTAKNPSELGYNSGQRWYKTEHSDIQWFRRALVCQTCFHQWLSAEIPESFLDELVKLRDALHDIKSNAEAYAKEADKASRSLAKLSKSLSSLQALKSYREQK